MEKFSRQQLSLYSVSGEGSLLAEHNSAAGGISPTLTVNGGIKQFSFVKGKKVAFCMACLTHRTESVTPFMLRLGHKDIQSGKILK